jgi:hypothetical protein
MARKLILKAKASDDREEVKNLFFEKLKEQASDMSASDCRDFYCLLRVTDGYAQAYRVDQNFDYIKRELKVRDWNSVGYYLQVNFGEHGKKVIVLGLANPHEAEYFIYIQHPGQTEGECYAMTDENVKMLRADLSDGGVYLPDLEMFQLLLMKRLMRSQMQEAVS